MEPAIAISGLTRRFVRKNAPPITAVDDLSLTIEAGEVFGVLGPNGAGKTTTVRLLNGLLSPTEGSARVLGLDPAQEGDAVRQQTGVLTETPSLYDTLSARQNLAFFGELYNLDPHDIPSRIDALLEEMGLSTRADDPVGTYSKGMRQRLAIARALLHAPRQLYFDEPTAGLDPAATRKVHQTIETLSHEQRTIVMCTHNLTEAQNLCDRVAVLDQGALRAVGTPRELARSLWQGASVVITLAGGPNEAVGLLISKHPAVRAHSLSGERLTLDLNDEDQIPDLVAAIAAAGGRIRAVQPQERSLEDIYFKIQETGGLEVGDEA